MQSFIEPIKVGARGSNLSKAQVLEVEKSLQNKHPSLRFDPIWIDSQGDKNKTVSLRDLEKSDFFTREIDEALLKGFCRIAIHSAKDLPEQLPCGISIVALTACVSPLDLLVLKDGLSLHSLPFGAKIATSSKRREDAVKQLRDDFTFKDIRGTIEERLEQLNSGKVDGVVIAEAALIRLKITEGSFIILPGPTAINQGRLAIVAREGDEEMNELFSFLDERQTLCRHSTVA